MNRLAVYGTLAPGHQNHHQLDGIEGAWSDGEVNGTLYEIDSGVHRGLLGIVLDPAAPVVPIRIFASDDLSAHWERLDAFEGDGFLRVVAPIRTATGDVDAWLYVLR